MEKKGKEKVDSCPFRVETVNYPEKMRFSMLSQDIRRKFLQYFKTQGHAIIPSSPVVPFDDPTLLFINAGMNQFKDVFLGKAVRDYKRAATSQKCIRVGGKHNDLENVGHTSRHLTFFEMLGNFSFGDYFKKEAIGFAWDVATHIFDLDPKKIWVSVYKDDDEAFSLWEKHVKTDRIVRFGEKENFWAMGDVGPCGPCSELLFDKGEKYGKASNPTEDLTGERYFEFWNLVFMQFERKEGGKQEPLPNKSIDTGAGLERLLSLKMGVDNVFLTDVLRSLIAEVETVSGKKYVEHSALAPAFHVIADHIRMLSFAIADGVQPSNTDRGYVLRKVLRRAVRYGRSLGLFQPFLPKILPCLVQRMGEDYPELRESQGRIAEILHTEEEAFLRTLQRGGNILNQVIEKAEKENRRIAGEDAFKLKDTYGLPIEEIELIAKDMKLEIDLKKFHTLEEEAKEKSRKAQTVTSQKFSESLFPDFLKTHKPSHFVGYSHKESDAHVQAILVHGAFTDSLKEGEEGMVILDETPFYAEMGGQVGDTGSIVSSHGEFKVSHTSSPYPGVIAHTGKLLRGTLKKQEKVHAKIDSEKRKLIENNHTATHLLHWALHKVLGEHVRQGGSLVDESRLRFDFSHHKPLTSEQLIEIENLVNEQVRLDAPVKTYELSYDEAQKRKDIKQFFGEKYGKLVRVVDIDFSKELCGGTHASKTGTIGLFKIARETSIAAGTRRIEALTGQEALRFVHEEEALLGALSSLLKVPTGKLEERMQSLLEENHALSLKVKQLRQKELSAYVEHLLAQVEKIHGFSFLVKEVSLSPDEMNFVADSLMERLRSGVVALGSKEGEKCQIIVRVSEDLSLDAKALIQGAAPLIKGGGGGKKTSAMAGGKDPSGLTSALANIRNSLKT